MRLKIKKNTVIDVANQTEKEFEDLNIAQAYWLYQPSNFFMKTLPPEAKVLDLGAGSGFLTGTQEYHFPLRKDLRLYALDLVYSSNFETYHDYQVCDFVTDQIKWPEATFDAIFSSHVIEHVPNVHTMFDFCARMLKEGGFLYIECPAAHTSALPHSDTFASEGVNIMPSNFFEDPTHVRPVSSEELRAAAEAAGFFVTGSGYVRNAFAEDYMLSFGRARDEGPFGWAMRGYWSKTLWSQYLIANRPDAYLSFVTANGGAAAVQEAEPAPEPAAEAAPVKLEPFARSATYFSTVPHASRGPLLEAMITEIYRQVLAPGDCAIDGGAHVGAHTARMARCIQPDGLVIGVEALTHLAQGPLAQAVQEFGDSVEIIAAALGREPGDQYFYEFTAAPGYSGLVPRTDLSAEIVESLTEHEVCVTTLDEIVATHARPGQAVKFIQLALEGGEFDGLVGGVSTLTVHRPVVVIAFGGRANSNLYGFTKEQFFEFFESIGYRLYSLLGEPITRESWGQDYCVWYAIAVHGETYTEPFVQNLLRSALYHQLGRGSAAAA